jgi:hypothetical protein
MPPAPKPGSVEEAIALALKNHPDVKLAEAKRMVADAELEQAKLLVTQKVTAAFAKVQLAKLRVDVAEKEFARVSELFKRGSISEQERAASEAALRTAKADLDAATAELQSAKGGAAKPTIKVVNTYGSIDKVVESKWDFAVVTGLERAGLHLLSSEGGSVGDKLRGLVEKKIPLDLKVQKVDDALTSPTMGEAFDALLKTAGENGLAVRLPARSRSETKLSNPIVLGSLTGERSFHSWIEMITDDFSSKSGERFEAYVREYGILVTNAKSAPPGAITLAEFTRQIHAEKKATETKKVEEPKKP